AAPQTFVVESLNLASLPEKDKAALLEFQRIAGEMQRAMMGAGAAAEDALKNLKYIRKALLDAPKADPKLAETARAIEKRIQDELVVLFGDRTRAMRSEPAEPSLMDRISAQLDATAPITATARRGYEIAAAGFEKLLEEMRQTIDVDLNKLQADLEAAGAPWTPGRGVPVWKR
ncbi:MAG: glycosyl hydrolase, partial [Candidatus Aminicenantes bacterium]|nr:glycosyl hydrolase [Candidatus Aminicenantes bacterium]